jgi:chemotaxis protein CheC
MNDNQAHSMDKTSQLMGQAADRAATAFAEMLNLPVSIKLSKAELVDDLSAGFNIVNKNNNWGKAVTLNFNGGIGGKAIFLLPARHDNILLSALFEQNPDLESIEGDSNGILTEIGNVLLNVCVGTIANHIEKQVLYQQPELIQQPDITRFFEYGLAGSPNMLLMISTLGVGKIEVDAYIVLVLYDTLQIKG